MSSSNSPSTTTEPQNSWRYLILTINCRCYRECASKKKKWETSVAVEDANYDTNNQEINGILYPKQYGKHYLLSHFIIITIFRTTPRPRTYSNSHRLHKSLVKNVDHQSFSVGENRKVVTKLLSVTGALPWDTCATTTAGSPALFCPP